MRNMIEILEIRRLLSVSLENGVLTVLGTPAADRIVVYYSRTFERQEYVVSGTAGSGRFPAADVRVVAVRSGAGNDSVDLATAEVVFPAAIGFFGPVLVPSRVDGGLGDDLIYGGASRDIIFAGFGNDRVFGTDGDDWLDGGWGDDVLSGGDGNDYVLGGLGSDLVTGSAGDDRLNGGPGDDHVGARDGMPGSPDIETGNDLLVGGPGEDWLAGGPGADRIIGGTGRDHFSRMDQPSEWLDKTPDEPVDYVIPV